MGELNNEMARVLTLMRGTDGYIMGDFNVDLLRDGTHGPTSDHLEGFMSRGFYPLISLPTRLTDTTATLIDNIWTNNVLGGLGSGPVTVLISDHLPVFAFVGVARDGGQGGTARGGGMRRRVNEGRIARFAERLEGWSFDEARSQGVEANVGRFRNEFRDMYDEMFPWHPDFIPFIFGITMIYDRFLPFLQNFRL